MYIVSARAYPLSTRRQVAAELFARIGVPARQRGTISSKYLQRLLPPAEAVLGLQLAYSMPDVILSFACLWRLRRLSREEPAGAQEEAERPQEKLLARASRSG